MRGAREFRDELGRSAEEATYLAVGLGILAIKELRHLRGGKPLCAPPVAAGRHDLADLAAKAEPLVEELRGLLGGFGRLARDLRDRGAA